MDCEIILSVNKNGTDQEVSLGKVDNSNPTFKDIKNLLKTLTKTELLNIKSTLPNIEEIKDINISDIDENSVGVLAPAELISTLPKSYQTILYKLNIVPEILKSNIIISGFGPADVKTQYLKNSHIFLNLNYLYDNDNKVMAIFETALYLSDPDSYKEKVTFLLNKDADPKVKREIITSAFKASEYDNLKEGDIDLIQSIYDFALMKKEGTEFEKEDQLNTADSVFEFMQSFNLNTVNTRREYNYSLPVSKRVETLKQGDLIKITFNGKDKYEVFYSYHINKEGQTVVKTYSPNSGQTINNRVLNSQIVDAREFNPSKYTNFSKTEGININFTDKLYYTQFEYVYDLIKNLGSKINGQQIKSLEGSIVTLDSGETINVKDVKELTLSKKSATFKTGSNLSEFPGVIDVTNNLKNIPNSTKVVLEEVVDGVSIFKEGLIIAKGISNLKNLTFIILTNDSKKNLISQRISASKIKYIIPDVTNIVSPSEKNVFDGVIKSVWNSNSVNEFLARKEERLLSFDYSIEKVNDSTTFNLGDILYDFNQSRYFKVVEATEGSIVLAGVYADLIRYIEFKREDFKNALLFTKFPVNTSFASDFIIKNRFKVDTLKNPSFVTGVNESQIIESVEVKQILQKDNGFIYQMTDQPHPKYKKEDTDITKAFKTLLEKRFNKTVKPTDKLYLYKYKDGTPVHDQFNTHYFNVKGKSLTSIVQYLVPGSYLTFASNAKAFVVEKVLDDKILLSAYHYTTAKLPKTNFSHNLISEKFVVNINEINPVALFIPRWATNSIKEIQKELVPITGKNSKLSQFAKEDSAEIVMTIANFISDKYGVKVNYITDNNKIAYVHNGEIFINLNEASIEEPLHELLHLILTTLKAKDSETYYFLMRSVQNHPLFTKISRLYSSDIEMEKLEETFVKILTETFRNRIKEDGIFSEEVFNIAMNDVTSELLKLSNSLENQDSINLLSSPINEIMTRFGSRLLTETNDLIDLNTNIRMLGIAENIKMLISNGNLIEDCK